MNVRVFHKEQKKKKKKIGLFIFKPGSGVSGQPVEQC